ncbi:MAG TPA: hypothetical protein VFA09_06985 [Ktedonobacteraceae bacterium]|nr:hypothetical protein [Ktedonobacteraceae bacterium]
MTKLEWFEMGGRSDRKDIAMLLVESFNNLIHLLLRLGKLGEIVYDDDVKRDRGKIEACERATVVLFLRGDQILADGQDLQSLLLCQRHTAGFPLGKFGFCSSMKIDGGLDVMLKFAGESQARISLLDIAHGMLLFLWWCG